MYVHVRTVLSLQPERGHNASDVLSQVEVTSFNAAVVFSSF